MRIKVIYRYQTDRKIILVLANTVALRVPKISSQFAYHFQLHVKCSNSCDRFNNAFLLWCFNRIEVKNDFNMEISRFIPQQIKERTIDNPEYWPYVQAEVHAVSRLLFADGSSKHLFDMSLWLEIRRPRCWHPPRRKRRDSLSTVVQCQHSTRFGGFLLRRCLAWWAMSGCSRRFERHVRCYHGWDRRSVLIFTHWIYSI